MRRPVLCLILTGVAADAALTTLPAHAAETTLPRKDVAPLVRQTFADKRFAFCHDPRYPLTSEEIRWCGALAPGTATDARCPALARACARGATASFLGARRPFQFSLPELPLPGRFLVWLLLAAAVAAVVLKLRQHALADRPAPSSPEARPPVPDLPATAPRQVETEVMRLLEQARAAAAAGDFAEAIATAYAALLRQLEQADIIRVEAHRTNGDHMRDVGAKLPALRPRVATVAGDVEEVEFGGAPATPERYRRVHDGVVALLAERLGLWLVAAALALGTMSCQPTRDGWDESPSGRAAWLSVLGSYGFEARERWAPLAKVDDNVDQLLLAPGAVVSDDEWKKLQEWVAGGGTLIVLGGDRPLPAWIGPRIAPGAGTDRGRPELTGEARDALGPMTVVIPGSHHLDKASQHVLVVREGEAYLAEDPVDDGRVLVFADDALFTNAALLAADNARFMTELLRQGGKRLELAGDLTGLVSPNPIASVQRGRLAPVVAELALLALLFFAYKGTHFGRPVDPVVVHRRAFSEHVRALGGQYARAGATRHASDVYGAYAVERLQERLRLVSGKSLSALAEAIAVRSGRSIAEVMRTLLETRDRQREEKVAHGPDLDLVRQMSTWLVETGGSGESKRVQGKV